MKVWFNLCSKFILRILFGLPVTCFRVCILSFFWGNVLLDHHPHVNHAVVVREFQVVHNKCMLYQIIQLPTWKTSWWLNQPIWNICSPKWESSPNRGEHTKMFETTTQNMFVFTIFTTIMVTSSVISMDSASPQWNHEHHETLPPPLPPLPGILEASKWWEEDAENEGFVWTWKMEWIPITYPWKFNIAPKIGLPKRKVVFQLSIFGGYVKLRGCIYIHLPMDINHTQRFLTFKRFPPMTSEHMIHIILNCDMSE